MKTRIEKLEQVFAAKKTESQSAVEDDAALVYLSAEEKDFWLWGWSRGDDGRLVPATNEQVERMEYLAIKMAVYSGEEIEENILSDKQRAMLNRVRAEMETTL